MNRVSLIGRITRDPEVRYSQAGVAFLSFSIAVDRQQRDANGQRQADFINCTAFGQQADFMGRYIKKGFMIAVCGRLQTRSYQDQTGAQHYVTEVVVEQIENLSPRDPNQPQAQPQQSNFQPQQNNPYQGYNNPSYGQPQQPAYGNQSNDNGTPKSFNVNVDDEDMPF